ncbi:hypothetical protein SAMN04488065_0619 [Haloplanus vescus]|uniref:Cyclophilin TM1367-like domain-containing protein n=1 Tax=Haloplanus vescus TaxID=555874 RepID=A0A1H3W705_9EURY|nr:cyclophilin-like fold protein [Haloplanus vescus]SDZ82885.1 hypothetical protein SAMN04488065_0619 [Haloplanus vescus]
MSQADLVVTVDDMEMDTTWLDESPTTREAIADALPLSGTATRWGDELYFRTPVDVDAEPTARAEVEPGTLAYWPQGNALCLFWGPTPASSGTEPRAASPVNVVARVDDPSPLSRLADGAGTTMRVTDG